MNVARVLACSAPSWTGVFPKGKPRKGEPPLVGDVLPSLFRIGYPHLRFVDEETTSEPEEVATGIFLGPWAGARMLLPRAVWTRFVRAYAGSVTTLTSDPSKRRLTPEAKRALASTDPFTPAEVPVLVRQLMGEPASLRHREMTEDFLFALEGLTGTETVSDAIAGVLEKPPPGKALPQTKALADDVARALGFVRLRLGGAARKALDARLEVLLQSRSKRYPIPTAQIRCFLHPGSAPRGSFVSEVLHSTNAPPVLDALRAFRPADAPLFLLDPRLVFLAGRDAIPIYLEKFAGYERALHPNVASTQLRAFVDAIAPFRDPRITAWLTARTTHRLVGEDAQAWLALLGRTPPS